jgi:hypothetical protein
VFLAVAITLVVLGAAFRPYVRELVADRDLWRDRAIAAEDAAQAYEYEGVRLIDPAADLDIWTRGMGPDES